MPEYNGHKFRRELKERTETKYIVIHHSLSEWGDADAIHQWHLKRKANNGVYWSGLGYHYVICNGFPTHASLSREIDNSNKGEVQYGRPLWTVGAHAAGFNHNSIGICCIGNYDQSNIPSKVWYACIEKCLQLCEKYKIPVENVVGHRETYTIRGKPVEKSCPGHNWSMNKFRNMLDGYLNPKPLPEPIPHTQPTPSPGGDKPFDTQTEIQRHWGLNILEWLFGSKR